MNTHRHAYFVTRHQGAREWVSKHVPDIPASAEFFEHLPTDRISQLAPGDIVAGTLPIHLIAEVNARGARYLHLVLDLPQDARGKENLTCEQMEQYGARLVPYAAIALQEEKRDLAPPPQKPTGKAAPTG